MKLLSIEHLLFGQISGTINEVLVQKGRFYVVLNAVSNFAGYVRCFKLGCVYV